MKQKMRMRFYCDFCKKSGGSSYHMKNHEKHCTMNPDRDCRMCDRTGGHGLTVKELFQSIGADDDQAINRLRNAALDCPACMMAAIRQNRDQLEETTKVPFSHSSHAVLEFNYQEEHKRFWAEMNDSGEDYLPDMGEY